MLIPLGFFGTGDPIALQLISTQVVGTLGSQITFSSIPQTYKHLQLRIIAKDATSSASTVPVNLRVNGVSTSSYTNHSMIGSGAAPTAAGNSIPQSSMQVGVTSANSGAVQQFGAFVIDILDYTNANKFANVRSFNGITGSSTSVGLYSGAYISTAAVTQLDVFTTNGFTVGSRFSLYGVKG